MNKVKIFIYSFFAVFSLFILYTYVKTLSPPDHIHSRDDVPQQPDRRQAMQAIGELETRLKEEPDNVTLWLQLGHIYLELRDFEKATTVFRQATVVDPENAEALVDLGIALNANNHSDKAYPIFKQAVQKFPQYTEGWLRLGLIYRFRLKDNASALQYLEKYIAMEPPERVDPRVKSEIEKIKQELKSKP